MVDAFFVFKTAMRKYLFTFLGLMIAVCNINAQYSLEYNEPAFLSIPDPPYDGYVANASWNVNNSNLSFDGHDEAGAIIYPNHYFEGSSVVTCNYRYEYYRNGHTQSGTRIASYTVSFKSNNATLSKSELSLQVGKTEKLSYQLERSYNSSNYGSPKMTWESNRESVATVDKNGKVTAVGPGSATITFDPVVGPPVYCQVTVINNPPTAISLPSTSKTKVGESVTLSPTLTPSDAYATISWKSSEESIATVSNGKVTGKNVGKTTITATTDNNLSAECIVTVEKTDVTLSADTESGTYAAGKTVTLKASRTDADIYYTLDGSTPTTKSTRYTTPISLTKTVTLKAIATGSNYETSSVLTRQYQITSLTVKDSWTEGDKQTPFFIPSVTFNTAVSNYIGIGDVKMTQGKTDIEGQALVQEGVLYFVPSSRLNMGSYTLTVPENAVINGNGEPNLALELNLVVGECFEPAPIMVAASMISSYAIRSDKSLWIWSGSTQVPTKVMDEVSKITAPPYFGSVCIIKSDSTLWIGTDKIMGNVVQAVSGYDHILVVKSDSSLWAWGSNYSGELGDGTKIDRSSPVKIMDDVVKASANFAQSFAIKADGSLWAWGSNDFGQLGADWPGTDRPNPVKIMDEVVKVSAGVSSTYAIKTDGTLWSWGKNSYGELGPGRSTGSRRYYTTPSKVMDDVAEIAAGFENVFFIKKDGSLWGWGKNTNGQMGAGTYDSTTKTYKIMNGVAHVSAGYRHTLAIKNDSTLWAWGDEVSGDGSRVPLCVMGNTPFSHVTGISLPGNIQMPLGGRYLLLPTVSPSNGCFETVSFESSNSGVATVSLRGIVEGKAMGTATITMIVDGKYKATCEIEVKNRDIEVSTSPEGYATFYSSESSYELPASLSAQVVTSVSNNKLLYQPLSGNIIPKATAVMLTSEVKRAGTYTLTSSDMTETYNGVNLLRGSDEATTTTGDGYHYKLSYGRSSSSQSDVFGWYWGAQNGGAFQIEGHKAWLVVPKSATRSDGFNIDGEATGITAVEAETEVSYYDLQGRRIEKPAAKGVYIVNGKKVMVK